MPIALNKVQKKIRRKKGALDALGDRDKNRMNRAALRDQKLKKQATLRHKRIEHDMIRVGYFKVATKSATEPLGTEKIRELIERWVHRDDDELERYERERRPGRPPAPKHTALKNRVEKEIEEFRTGFYMPDLQDWENIENLQHWDGKTGSLALVEFTRVAKDDPPPPEDRMEL